MHYLNQYGPRSMLPYGIIMPQWIKPEQYIKVLMCVGLCLFNAEVMQKNKNPGSK